MTGNRTLGRRIAVLREEKRWTQKQLAEKAGITSVFLSELENDKRNPSTEVLLRIADALGASMDYLATGRTAAGHPRRPLVLPPGLVEAAERLGWSLGHTADVLRARQIVIARRSKAGLETDEDWSSEEWEQFEKRLFADGEAQR